VPYPEWRRNPGILRAYCQPEVIDAIKLMGDKSSVNFHFVNILRNNPAWDRVQSILNLTPSTADLYRCQLPFFFKQKEVERIMANPQKIETRIHRLVMRRRAEATYWDMIREDLDDVCQRAIVEHFAREDLQWIVPRLAHRSRRFGCGDAYAHREPTEWKIREVKWWLEGICPRFGKLVERLGSDVGF
jgi:hypothetical protein